MVHRFSCPKRLPAWRSWLSRTVCALLLLCSGCSQIGRTQMPTPSACASWLYTPYSLQEARDVREAAFCFAASYCRVLMEQQDECYDLCFALKQLVVQPLSPQELYRAVQDLRARDAACNGQLRPALEAPLRGLWARLGEYEGEK